MSHGGWTCPNCGHYNPSGNICKNCGAPEPPKTGGGTFGKG